MVVGSIALLAGLDTVVHPIFHLMDIDDATQARALNGCGSTFLDNLNYGARMMTFLSSREHFSSVETGDLAR